MGIRFSNNMDVFMDDFKIGHADNPLMNLHWPYLETRLYVSQGMVEELDHFSNRCHSHYHLSVLIKEYTFRYSRYVFRKV